MRCDRFGNAGNVDAPSGRPRSTASPADVAADSIAREEPLLGLVHWPPVAQDFQQLWGEHDIAIFLSFALLDSNDHSLTVDIGGFQADGLGDAQPGGVAGRQDRAMLELCTQLKKLQDFFRTQDNRQLLRLLGRRDDFFQGPVLMKRDFVEETKSGYGDEDGTGSQLLFVGQVDLVRANLLGPSSSGDLLKWRANSETCCT